MWCAFVTRFLFSGAIFFFRYCPVEKYMIPIKSLACSFAVATSVKPWVLEITLAVVLV